MNPAAGAMAQGLQHPDAASPGGAPPSEPPPMLTGRAAQLVEKARSTAATGSLAEALTAVARYRASRSMTMLALFATHAADPRVRIRALRAVAELFGAEARPILLSAVEDVAELEKVRREAARLLGRTGSGAGAELDRLVNSDLPPRVRGGAVLGLAELGTAIGATRAFGIAATPEHPMRLEAATALARMSAPEAARRLAALLTEEEARQRSSLPEAARVAVCQSLGQSHAPEAARPLTDLLETDKSAAVRAAAAHALGVLGQKDAMKVLAAARADPVAEVARAAHIAWSRLSHLSD